MLLMHKCQLSAQKKKADDKIHKTHRTQHEHTKTQCKQKEERRRNSESMHLHTAKVGCTPICIWSRGAPGRSLDAPSQHRGAHPHAPISDSSAHGAIPPQRLLPLAGELHAGRRESNKHIRKYTHTHTHTHTQTTTHTHTQTHTRTHTHTHTHT